jgi:hypothetical protein
VKIKGPMAVRFRPSAFLLWKATPGAEGHPTESELRKRVGLETVPANLRHTSPPSRAEQMSFQAFAAAPLRKNQCGQP